MVFRGGGTSFITVTIITAVIVLHRTVDKILKIKINSFFHNHRNHIKLKKKTCFAKKPEKQLFPRTLTAIQLFGSNESRRHRHGYKIMIHCFGFPL